MKNSIKMIVFLIIILLSSSCSTYIASVHDELNIRQYEVDEIYLHSNNLDVLNLCDSYDAVVEDMQYGNTMSNLQKLDSIYFLIVNYKHKEKYHATPY